jgi:hypothetical protein
MLNGTDLGSRGEVSLEDHLSMNIPYEDRTHGGPTSWAARSRLGVLPRVQVSDFEMVCMLDIGSKGKVTPCSP